METPPASQEMSSLLDVESSDYDDGTIPPPPPPNQPQPPLPDAADTRRLARKEHYDVFDRVFDVAPDSGSALRTTIAEMEDFREVCFTMFPETAGIGMMCRPTSAGMRPADIETLLDALNKHTRSSASCTPSMSYHAVFGLTVLRHGIAEDAATVRRLFDGLCNAPASFDHCGGSAVQYVIPPLLKWRLWMLAGLVTKRTESTSSFSVHSRISEFDLQFIMTFQRYAWPSSVESGDVAYAWLGMYARMLCTMGAYLPGFGISELSHIMDVKSKLIDFSLPAPCMPASKWLIDTSAGHLNSRKACLMNNALVMIQNKTKVTRFIYWFIRLLDGEVVPATKPELLQSLYDFAVARIASELRALVNVVQQFYATEYITFGHGVESARHVMTYIRGKSALLRTILESNLSSAFQWSFEPPDGSVNETVKRFVHACATDAGVLDLVHLGPRAVNDFEVDLAREDSNYFSDRIWSEPTTPTRSPTSK